MPELPEVETYRRYLEASSLNQTIEDMTCEDGKLLLNDIDDMREILRGSQFIGTYRVGKNLFVQLNNPHWLSMHFGMTGDLAYFHRDEGAPRHARIVFYFANGYGLGFICPRKFERIGLTNNPTAYLQKKKVAADVLEISAATFFDNIKKRKMPIKSVLLDQSVVAGIGNWLADDVLYRAGVHPETLANQIKEGVAAKIHEAMRYVVQTTIEAEANYDLLPDAFILHSRGWGKPHLAGQCACGQEAITQIRVGGRATYFCASRQVIERRR